MDERVRVGLLGCGNVGGALVRLIPDHADVIEARTGVPLEVARVAVRNLAKDRDLPLPARCFTDDAGAVVGDPDVDVVVEVIGGIEPARDADRRGARWPASRSSPPTRSCSPTSARELFETAEGAGVDLLFEASVGRRHPAHPAAARVAGRRPHPPRDGHRQRHHQLHPHPDDRGGRVVRRRARRGAAPRLRRARPHRRRRGLRRRGQGGDHRVASPSARASSPATCTTRASAGITAADIAVGHATSATSSSCSPSPRSSTARSPCACTRRWCPARHPLASVRDSFNAVFVEGDAVGELMFYGRGAGGAPTASAVLGDLVDAAKNLVEGRKGATIGTLAPKPIRPIDDVESQFYLHARGGRPARRARARSPACSATTACRSGRCSRRASATTPASSSSPTRRARPICAPPCVALARRRRGAPRRLGAAGDRRRG